MMMSAKQDLPPIQGNYRQLLMEAPGTTRAQKMPGRAWFLLSAAVFVVVCLDGSLWASAASEKGESGNEVKYFLAK